MKHHPQQSAGNQPIEISCSEPRKSRTDRAFGARLNILTLRHCSRTDSLLVCLYSAQPCFFRRKIGNDAIPFQRLDFAGAQTEDLR